VFSLRPGSGVVSRHEDPVFRATRGPGPKGRGQSRRVPVSLRRARMGPCRCGALDLDGLIGIAEGELSRSLTRRGVPPESAGGAVALRPEAMDSETSEGARRALSLGLNLVEFSHRRSRRPCALLPAEQPTGGLGDQRIPPPNCVTDVSQNSNKDEFPQVETSGPEGFLPDPLRGLAEAHPRPSPRRGAWGGHLGCASQCLPGR
jgi:hypothetical protein